jgi:hypothetical protein
MCDWGKINDGARFGVMTWDLDRAIACLGLGVYEARLLQYVREQSWGSAARWKGRHDAWPEAVPCRLNLNELSRVWVVGRNRLAEAKSSLIARNLIAVDGDAVTINKDVDTWVGLRPEDVAYARQAIEESKAAKKQRGASGKPAMHLSGNPAMHLSGKPEGGLPENRKGGIRFSGRGASGIPDTPLNTEARGSESSGRVPEENDDVVMDRSNLPGANGAEEVGRRGQDPRPEPDETDCPVALPALPPEELCPDEGDPLTPERRAELDRLAEKIKQIGKYAGEKLGPKAEIWWGRRSHEYMPDDLPLVEEAIARVHAEAERRKEMPRDPGSAIRWCYERVVAARDRGISADAVLAAERAKGKSEKSSGPRYVDQGRVVLNRKEKKYE